MDTKERRRHMRGCVETAASLVCCTEVELGRSGEVGEILNEMGDKERTNDPLTIRSNPSFTVRWTCLSLVAIWNMVDGNRVQELARFALDGIARFQTEYGAPDTGVQVGNYSEDRRLSDEGVGAGCGNSCSIRTLESKQDRIGYQKDPQ